MNYREQERKRVTERRDSLFRDSGGGEYKNIPRKFVLEKSELNLWGGIRDDAIKYFKTNNISWWGSGDSPTGHLLSSQVACINHLYFLRQRSDIASAVLSKIENQIKKAVTIDNGFVEFEMTGSQKLGKEKLLTRGANCTSIDAMMIGETLDQKLILFLIEWKYTEFYSRQSKLSGKPGRTRWEAYLELLHDVDCPISHRSHKDLFYEPFYQLMRQTLLGWEMVKRKEYGVDDWIHVHVIPEENKKLKEDITSPDLTGSNAEEAWKNVLRDPEKYIVIDPKDFLEPINKYADTKSLLTYLENRYWS